MIVFPNAKINLGLNVVNRRADGYHDLQSGFFPVPWCDILEVLPNAEMQFQSTGIPIPGDPQTNLALKAWQLLRADHGIPPVKIHLQKNIPIGAGLGGGSADGAFALKALNQLFELQLTELQLAAYAQQLGSDCPFFIANKPAYVTGTGNVFSAIDCSLSELFILVCYPGIHISTAEAYQSITPQLPKYPTKTVLEQGPAHWKQQLTNDFEQALSSSYPVIPQLCEQFYTHGALYAAMTGSGSAVFGIFENATKIELPENYQTWQGKIL